MDAGLVRGILWRHLATARPALARGAPEPDPVDLAPAGPYADALLRLGRAHGDLELRRLGRDYAALWGRSFPNLVRHLRGRPERALSLWAEEVYPFLRGDRLAARLEPTGRGAAHLTLADDLPSTYLAGMVEGFLGLAGAESSCEAGAAGRFDVRWNLRAELWLASSVRRAAALRIPLLACAFLSALVGASAGAGLAEGSALLAGSLVVVGAVAAQSGANAIQDLRNPERESPLDAGRLPRSWSWFQCLGSYAVAAACSGALLAMGRPWIVPLAAVGLALGVLYAFLRDQGWGPAIAGLTYGPLMVTGSAYAVAGPAAFAHP
ncbi:MAG TPA: hypothetical protein VI796_05195, partial [Candidatus Thermoplasmatota archaeon]|nr:hypothetical protein [Candidatus Thermoplasmatota archaeon]